MIPLRHSKHEAYDTVTSMDEKFDSEYTADRSADAGDSPDGFLPQDGAPQGDAPQDNALPENVRQALPPNLALGCSAVIFVICLMVFIISQFSLSSVTKFDESDYAAYIYFDDTATTVIGDDNSYASFCIYSKIDTPIVIEAQFVLEAKTALYNITVDVDDVIYPGEPLVVREDYWNFSPTMGGMEFSVRLISLNGRA